MFVVGFEFNPVSIRKIEIMRNINKAMVEVADLSQSFTFEDPEISFRTKFPYIKKYMNLSDAAKFKTPPTEPTKRLKFEVHLLMAKKRWVAFTSRVWSRTILSKYQPHIYFQWCLFPRCYYKHKTKFWHVLKVSCIPYNV